MRVKGTTVQQVILGLALLAALCWNLAQANEINDLQLSMGPTGTRAELRLQSATAIKTMSLSQPDRLVLDLADVSIGKTLQLPAPAGLVKAVRSGHPAPGTTRIVFELAAPITVLKPRLEPGVDGVRLVLEWPGDGVAPVATVPRTVLPAPASASLPLPQSTSNPPPSASTAAPNPVLAGSMPGAHSANGAVLTSPDRLATVVAPVPPVAGDAINPLVTKPLDTKPLDPVLPSKNDGKIERLPRNLAGRSLIVAIDAGHGGQDPGAHGPSGKREKDVTLAIARELARQVNAMPGLKAYLTRDTDVFLPLPRRTQLARGARADIFVSIHADAAESRSARGSSVYVLSLRGASSQRARWLADKENAADLIGGTPAKADNTLTSVLLDLTQSGQMRASEDAAGHVLSGLKEIGTNHKPQIERANFAVLRTSDMPAMLVETAFISNPDEEQRLTDPSYQRSLARAVLDGIHTYFMRQPPPGTQYAARARAKQGDAAAAAPIVTAQLSTATTGGGPE